MGECLVKGWECNRCKYQWAGRQKGKIPIICPVCKSPYWNRMRLE